MNDRDEMRFKNAETTYMLCGEGERKSENMKL